MSLQETSKYMSLILRHKPETIGISLDEHGWANVDELIAGISKTHEFNREMLEEIVRTDNKQRYSFNEDKTLIRANQGHSIPVDVELEEVEPPKYLYHGTGEKFRESIDAEGLKPKSRLYVHLSEDIETATKVGSRHGKPVVYRVFAGWMHKNGFRFYRSVNGVWLTKDVPTMYIKRETFDEKELAVVTKEIKHILTMDIDDDDRGYKKHTMDNWKMYPNVPTAFSILIGDIQCVRASIISSNMKTVVFVPSWNIWASPLNKLKGFYSNKITDDNVTGEPKTKDVEYLELTKKYYRESIYHTFLHCPDDVVAYFSTEPTRKEDYYIRLSGKYNDLSNVIDKYIYYRDSYDVLQDILTSINYLIGNKVIKSLNDVLADESLPFVISGVNAGKTNIWRITFDDAYVFSIAKASRSGIRFNICGKEVFFEKGIINNENKSELGYWIETPAEVIPKISTSTEKYYKDNAAYACNCVEERGLEGKKGVIKYSYYNSHTVFGDIPRSQIIEFCFKPISLLDKYTCVFYQNSFNETPNKEDEHIHVRIGPEKNKYKNKGNSMLFRISKDNNIVDGTKCYVEVGKIYKLVLRIDYNSETDASIINRTISFTLFSEDNAEQIISQYSFDNSFTNPSRKKIITSLITLLYPQCNNILDYIKIEDFRIYFEKRFEKLEVFRERDGVNVTKVNKTNHVYADLPVQTLSSDKLIGKITWMNPTNAEVSYKVLYRKNNKSVSRFMCKSSVVIFPEDGRITSDIQQFKDSGMFSVAPQSEGYILFDLPKNGIQTDSIEIGLCLLERSKILTRTRERAFLPQHYKATVLEDYLIPIEPL